MLKSERMEQTIAGSFLDHKVHDFVIVSFIFWNERENVTGTENVSLFFDTIKKKRSQNILKYFFLHKRNVFVFN